MESIMGKPIPSGASTKSWAVWLGATVVSFAALESYAVGSRRIPTLSHCLRCWLGISPVKRHRHLAALVFAAFWSWLVCHVVLGIGPNLKQPGGTPCAER